MEPNVSNFEKHVKVIIHVDIDCFYAQVEMVKNPNLTNVPLGIQQKNIVVTSNYKAREFGVNKCMFVNEALKLCPNLVLVNGEDLHDYRRVSYNITTFLQKYSPLVERLGLDENFIDVTNIAQEKLLTTADIKPVGCVFGEKNSDRCQCGCQKLLDVGSTIAKEIRESIREEFKLTCSAGISHNKLLAKLAGGINKPDQQTILYPNDAFELMCSLKSITHIPGIGRALTEILEKENILKVTDLHNYNFEKLKKLVGDEKAKLIKNLSLGIDSSAVKPSGKPLSIGIEDSCKTITALVEIRAKLKQLLSRLKVLIVEDGRVPKAIKVTIRKYDEEFKISRRETKQTSINSTLFTIKDNQIMVTQKSEEKLMVTIMSLVNKMISANKPYHVTLLGLSFTKFIERANPKTSITSFLKRESVEVQSLTDIKNNCNDDSLMDFNTINNEFIATDGSESDFEPSPKKTKQVPLVVKRKHLIESDDCPSPSKLKVADLHLGNDKEDASNSNNNNHDIHCPPQVDVDVFKDLPKEIQMELWDQHKKESDNRRQSFQRRNVKPKVNTLLNYFVKNN